MIPDYLVSQSGLPWAQIGEAYVVYTIQIKAEMCVACPEPHNIVTVIQTVNVSFTLDVGRDELMNAPPLFAGACMQTDDEITLLHTDTILELIREAHERFNRLITPGHILGMMREVYHLEGKDATHVLS